MLVGGGFFGRQGVQLLVVDSFAVGAARMVSECRPRYSMALGSIKSHHLEVRA